AGEQVDLHGGPGGNRFTVSGWSGSGKLDGGGGTDQGVARNDMNFGLTDQTLTRSSVGNGVLIAPTLNLSSLEQATLTGGPGANSFTVSQWSGTAALDGGDGGDAYTVTFLGSGAGTTTITDTGATGTDAVQVNGTPLADMIQVLDPRVT